MHPCRSQPSEIANALLCQFTVDELARACEVSRRTVYAWAAGACDDSRKRNTRGLTNLRRVAAHVTGISCIEDLPPARSPAPVAA